MSIGENGVFEKYRDDGAYHWHRTHDTPMWRRGIRLLARYDLAAKQVKRLVAPGGKGLDVGCGDGFLIYSLARLGYTAAGVDLSEDGLALAKRRLHEEGRETRLEKASAYALPVADKSLDFVTCVEVIEHLENPAQAVSEAYRVLRAGGIYVCTTPQREPDQAPDAVRDPYHIREYIADEFRRELAAIFEQVSVYGAYPGLLDRWYRPGRRAGFFRQAIRFGLRLSCALGWNPYLFTSSSPKPTDQLLVAVAVKSGEH